SVHVNPCHEREYFTEGMMAEPHDWNRRKETDFHSAPLFFLVSWHDVPGDRMERGERTGQRRERISEECRVRRKMKNGECRMRPNKDGIGPRMNPADPTVDAAWDGLSRFRPTRPGSLRVI